ncbi:MAG TPA: hypothetical protein VFI65_06205 [Streptosporangiaceae bacterium]|nr:hypothetical protein [Streptosporangiaceae bacterium]
MPAPTISRDSPASRRNSDSRADQALAKIIDLLLVDGFGFTIPAWDGDAYLKINNALHAITDLTITSHGNLTWDYRSIPSRLIGMIIGILDPDRTRRPPTLPQHDGYPLVEVIRYALYRYGFTAAITETGTDTGPVLTATNPDQPYRGTIEISDDGELSWRARTPHHPDGGIPLPDIATTITRALTQAQHRASHA